MHQYVKDNNFYNGFGSIVLVTQCALCVLFSIKVFIDCKPIEENYGMIIQLKWDGDRYFASKMFDRNIAYRGR